MCQYLYEERRLLGCGIETNVALAGVTQLADMSFCKPKGCGFDCQSGHIPKF